MVKTNIIVGVDCEYGINIDIHPTLGGECDHDFNYDGAVEKDSAGIVHRIQHTARATFAFTELGLAAFNLL